MPWKESFVMDERMRFVIRLKDGHPQQNGRHERMHLTLKKEATRPAGANQVVLFLPVG